MKSLTDQMEKKVKIKMFKPKFIGLLSCSGEDFPGGSISRVATRKVLTEFLPGMTTAICVPLFLNGNEQETKFVKNFPCITIDGCEKACVKKSLEAMGKKPVESINLSEFFSKDEYKQIMSGPIHDLDWNDNPLTLKLAEHIAILSAKHLKEMNMI